MKTKFHPHSDDATRTPPTLAATALLAAGVLLGWLASNLQAQDNHSDANTRDTSTLFENVRIFDGKSAQLSAPSYVLVRGIGIICPTAKRYVRSTWMRIG
jgi:hypothetical protein